jgi:hypothetical protein
VPLVPQPHRSLRWKPRRSGRHRRVPPCAVTDTLSAPPPVPNRPVVRPWPSSTLSRPSPASSSPEFGRSRRRPWPRGHFARPPIFPRCLVRTEGIYVNSQKILGTLVKNQIFNSVAVLLKIVKSVDNCKKIRRMQTQFCWIPCEKHYNFCKACSYFFLIVFA